MINIFFFLKTEIERFRSVAEIVVNTRAGAWRIDENEHFHEKIEFFLHYFKLLQNVTSVITPKEYFEAIEFIWLVVELEIGKKYFDFICQMPQKPKGFNGAKL